MMETEDFLIRPVVDAALREDLGRRGDVTTAAILRGGTTWPSRIEALITARGSGCVAGLGFVRQAFLLLDPDVALTFFKKDGDMVAAGEAVVSCVGSPASILASERVALNFLGHLSGVATQTRVLVDAVRGTRARVCATRKTIPGLRLAQKNAVIAGGGLPHRFGLDDGTLIKDNHLALVGGDVAAAVESVRRHAGHTLCVQVEVESLEQLEQAMKVGVDAVLLDNMPPEQIAQCVVHVGGRSVVEASGGVTATTARAVALAGVDLISCGSLTHSVQNLDVGLDVAEQRGETTTHRAKTPSRSL